MLATTSPDTFQIDVDCSGDGWTLGVRGALDLSTGRELISLGMILGEGQPGIVTVDLSGLDFVDTAGLHAVAITCGLVRAAGGSPVVAGTSCPPVTRLLDALQGSGLTVELAALRAPVALAS